MDVIYHANCNDGFCAAYVLFKAFGSTANRFYPMNYGDPIPDSLTSPTLYILDFSFDPDVLSQLAVGRKIYVFDHHKTAIEKLAGFKHPNVTLVLEDGKSGARITSEQLGLFENHWLVRYTEDRDLWINKLAYTEEINTALQSTPKIFSVWDQLVLNAMIEKGQILLDAKKEVIAYHVARAEERELFGYKVLVVNATIHHSDIAGVLAKGRPFAAVYFDRKGGIRQWSLRSSEDGVDVSALAKSVGGGGHKHAAGYEEHKGF
jgi:oligoribonuclease NrnB/cAMP/cGMP phosphodiesterase (DHH superfamily)